jgi:hypothetical protein
MHWILSPPTAEDQDRPECQSAGGCMEYPHLPPGLLPTGKLLVWIQHLGYSLPGPYFDDQWQCLLFKSQKMAQKAPVVKVMVRCLLKVQEVIDVTPPNKGPSWLCVEHSGGVC